MSKDIEALIERLLLPVTMSMFATKTDLYMEILQQRKDAASELSSLREENEGLRKEKTEIAMTALAADGQAQEAFVALSASQAQLKIYREALEGAEQALCDWLNSYAPDLCEPQRAAEAQERLGRLGVIAFIAEALQPVRNALSQNHEQSE